MNLVVKDQEQISQIK